MEQDEREALLTQLAEAVDTQQRAGLDRDWLIRRGVELGIPKTTLASTAKLSRRSVYDILEKS